MSYGTNSDIEVITPRFGRSLSDESLDNLATVLDECFHIPGTKWRVGIDAIIGLIPGLGDIVTGLLSFIIIFAAWSRGLPKIAILRMMMNVAIDIVIGAVPFFGDAFDAYWKVNRMNFNLLMRYQHSATPRREAFKDWLFLLFVGATTFIILALPAVVVVLIVHWIWR